MSEQNIVQVVRLVAVLALICVAAAIATPKGRLPLAIRGLAKLLRQDTVSPTPSRRNVDQSVPLGRRLLAFLLVLLAILLAIV